MNRWYVGTEFVARAAPDGKLYRSLSGWMSGARRNQNPLPRQALAGPANRHAPGEWINCHVTTDLVEILLSMGVSKLTGLTISHQ